MGFKSEYSRRLSRSGDTYKYGEGKTILEFFGFKYEKWTSGYTQRVWSKDDRYVGGGYYLTGNENDHYEGYRRATSPSGRAAELENRFIELRGEYYDPLKAPYEKKSVKEYYDGLPFPGQDEWVSGCGFGILISVIWWILCAFTRGLINAWAEKNEISHIWLICILLVPFVVCMIGTILGKIKQIMNRKKYGVKTPYCDLTREEKERYREEYLNKLESSYKGGEEGRILKEYAILKGYDKI